MAVLVEAISVIVRRDAIDGAFDGGWRGFVSSVPNVTLSRINISMPTPAPLRRDEAPGAT
jgi:hypothetical protein